MRRVLVLLLLAACEPAGSPPVQVAQLVVVTPVAPQSPLESSADAGTESQVDAGTTLPGARGNVRVGSVTSSPAAPVPTAPRVAAGLRPRFRACYQAGLAREPSMTATITVIVSVQADGQVSNTSVSSGTGLSSPVEACVLRVARSAVFEAPGGAGSLVAIPLTFGVE
jgi:outer membrane biosynthesis protein TonB